MQAEALFFRKSRVRDVLVRRCLEVVAFERSGSEFRPIPENERTEECERRAVELVEELIKATRGFTLEDVRRVGRERRNDQ